MTSLEELTKFDLTDEERESIANIIATPGWKALTKVWDHQSKCNSMSCRTVHEDHRFWQGYAGGFDAALQLAVKFSHPKEAEFEKRAPSEADLVARPKRIWSDSGTVW